MTGNKYQYNSWPIGEVPMGLQRREVYRLKEVGYKFDDAREIVDLFENKVAKFAGCKYAVAVDCCSHGIFLSLQYLHKINELKHIETIIIPNRTYISIPMQILNSFFEVEYEDIEWSGVYQLKPTRVWDGAVRWTKDMYVGDNALQVVSFQFKKRIPIGKGGMILTDDFEAYKMLKLMSYDGRDLTLPYDDPNHIKCLGYHMYMTPEDAARGILLMDAVPEVNEDSGNNTMYPDVEKMMNNF
jgi:dTDP-4-amino-4,6-dideoxygalactose transaminase